MLQPKRTKFRKAHKGRIHGARDFAAPTLAFGQYGLKAMEPERVTARQIEAARRAITRHMKRAGRVWIRIFPDVPVSKKPLEVRMGSGKGAPEFWVARVKPGRILFEIDGVAAQAGARGAGARRRQAADQDALRRAHRRVDVEEPSMKPDDLRAMTIDQLDDEVLKLKKEQFNLRFQRATGQLENTSRVREVRRDIARIKTVAAQKRARASRSRTRTQGASDARSECKARPGRRGQRQAGQDHRRAGRAPLHASGAEEDGAQLEEVLRPRREATSSRSATVVLDRGAPPDVASSSAGK